jgi:serine/threonine protein kinase
MATPHQSSLSFGAYSSLASDHNTKVSRTSASATRPSEQYADYGFIAVLGLAQRLRIGFLPIRWQSAMGRIGGGGQARVNQGLVNVQTSFAFKCFNHQLNDPFREIVREMVVLGHPTIRKHNHILRLEGICWDIPNDNDVWPVLVFQKAHLGDLYSFSRSARFRSLSIEDRLNLCTDIGIAVRDMHHIGTTTSLTMLPTTNQALGIVHGDIKPGNVLVFDDGSRFIAKVADFGFSTCFQSDDDLISIPKSEPWNAPEVDRGGQLFTPSQAKRVDVYSFALLCTWLVLDMNPSTDCSPRLDTENNSHASIGQHQPMMDLFRLWKSDASNRLAKWAKGQVHQSRVFDNSTKVNLESFISSSLVLGPLSRSTDFEELLSLLTPER